MVDSAVGRVRSRGARLAATALLACAACGGDREREAYRDMDARLTRLERRAAYDSARMARAALAHLDSAFGGGAPPLRIAWRVTRMDRDSGGACVWAAAARDTDVASIGLGPRDGIGAVRVTRDGSIQGVGASGAPCP